KGIYPKGRLARILPLSLRLEVGVFSPNFDKRNHSFFRALSSGETQAGFAVLDGQETGPHNLALFLGAA
ncbi:hypothetical protein, partial [Exiguobacterium antarcticum]|uniref:hypothetical protein n=1 Tax=Exiguobacterium antarcticum TaxID=132920 RepID=UPI0021C41822